MLYSSISRQSEGLIGRVDNIIVLGILSCSKKKGKIHIEGELGQRESSYLSGSN